MLFLFFLVVCGTVDRGDIAEGQTIRRGANKPMKILYLAAGISPQGALHNLCHTDCTKQCAAHPHTCNNTHKGILVKVAQAFLAKSSQTFAMPQAKLLSCFNKGSLAVKKVQFFLTLFKKPLTPPPFRLNIMW